MAMLNDFIRRIDSAESAQEYEKIVKELEQYLKQCGRTEEVLTLGEIAGLRKNRFSGRETAEDFAAKKATVLKFCATLEESSGSENTDRILSVLKNFSSFCSVLYKSRVHEKCSDSMKTHFTGFGIGNEYDLQKLMLAALMVVFPDVRIEAAQDSGHHEVRKDVVIDSEAAAIELKCTRAGMTERQLSEEVASDIIHYDCKRLYFYIYDKAGIIRNAASFQRTYEESGVADKTVHIFIYSHVDI